MKPCHEVRNAIAEKRACEKVIGKFHVDPYVGLTLELSGGVAVRLERIVRR